MPRAKKPSKSSPNAAFWFVYMLRARDGSLYTGIALDVEKRLKAHSGPRGSKSLRGRLPVELVHCERHVGRSAALRREAQIKNWPRAQKLKFITAPKTPPRSLPN